MTEAAADPACDGPTVLRLASDADLHAAVRHLEDLDVFLGQRSRMHPGPGWAVALALLREDLAAARAESASRGGAAR